MPNTNRMWKNKGSKEIWNIDSDVQTFYTSHKVFLEYAVVLFAINSKPIIVYSPIHQPYDKRNASLCTGTDTDVNKNTGTDTDVNKNTGTVSSDSRDYILAIGYNYSKVDDSIVDNLCQHYGVNVTEFKNKCINLEGNNIASNPDDCLDPYIVYNSSIEQIKEKPIGAVNFAKVLTYIQCDLKIHLNVKVLEKFNYTVPFNSFANTSLNQFILVDPTVLMLLGTDNICRQAKNLTLTNATIDDNAAESARLRIVSLNHRGVHLSDGFEFLSNFSVKSVFEEARNNNAGNVTDDDAIDFDWSDDNSQDEMSQDEMTGDSVDEHTPLLNSYSPKKRKKCSHVGNDSKPETSSGTGSGIPLVDYSKEKVVMMLKSINTIYDILNLPSDCSNKYVQRLVKTIPVIRDVQTLIGIEQMESDLLEIILYFASTDKLSTHQRLHTIIYGEPGSGKSTFAQILAKLYCALGVLPTSKVHSVQATDLIAGYVGQTAGLTQKAIDKAMGGVLFIDEAYSIGTGGSKGSTGSAYSEQCLDTLNRNLTEKGDKFVCILAGYKTDIQNNLLSKNRGLERRFNFRFEMPKLSGKDLLQILGTKLSSANCTIDTSSQEMIDFFEKNPLKYQGGDLENIITTLELISARRVVAEGKVFDDSERTIILQDVQKAYERCIGYRIDKNITYRGMFI